MENFRPLIIVAISCAILMAAAALFFALDGTGPEVPEPKLGERTAGGNGQPSAPKPGSASGHGTLPGATDEDAVHTAGDEPSAGEEQGGGPSRRAAPPADDGAPLPMQAVGADRGIDTTMDADWSPASEAQGWFSALDDAFIAARPLTPQVYREIMNEHQGTVTDVLKRAAEIADEEGQEAGMAFIEEWNGQVDQYKREAQGSF